MEKQRIEIINKLGLHARAASKLAAVCAKFSSKIQITKDGKTVDGKSIMALMLLAASMGIFLDISCEGADEAEAMRAITALINDRFGEAE